MEYITKVKIDGSILIESEPSTALPYISNVVVQEATSINKGIDIGGTASNKLTFELYNSPLNGFDGLKVELYAKEKVEAEEGILSLVGTHTDEDILEDITKSDVYEADTPPEEPTASEVESDTIMSSFGYTSGTISGIASDPDSVTYSASETTASASGSFDGEMPTRDAGTYASATMTAGASDDDDFQMVGTFYITSAKDMGAFVSVTALDGFILMGDTFTPTTKTTTLYALYEDFRAKLLAKGIEVEEEAFDDETVVTWTPSASFRESAGIFAGMLGGYANFNRSGVLAIRQYALGGYDIAYSSLIGIDESGDTVQIYSVMNGNAKSYSIYPTDAEVDDGTLQFSNSMVTAEQLEEIGSMYIGVEYQPATVQTDFFLNIEAGDFINVDVYDHNITICNTNQTINFDEGVTTITSLGDSSILQVQKLLSDTGSTSDKVVTKYVTDTGNGIRVHPEGDDSNYVYIDADSVDIYSNDMKVVSFAYESSILSSIIESDQELILKVGENNINIQNGGVWIDGMPMEQDDTLELANAFGSYVKCNRCVITGGMVYMTLLVTKTTSTSSGSNVASGTVSPLGGAKYPFLPASAATGVGYYGEHALVMILKSDGSFVVRNASGSAVTPKDTCVISLAYSWL